MIRNITKQDISAICDIYNYYVRNTISTFEEEEVGVWEMEMRMEHITLNHPWIVFEENGRVVGYAYANLWNKRSAYRFTLETTVYLDIQHHGKGIGSKLYLSLISELRKSGIHSLIGGISLPNPESVALHEKFAFEKCAHFKEVGKKFDKWIDVGYWEKIL